MTSFIRKYFHLLMIFILSLLVFLINLFEFYTNLYIPLLYYMKEFFTLSALGFSYYFWNKIETYKKLQVQYVLKSFLFSLLIFVSLLLFRALFFSMASYSPFFPYVSENIYALIFSAIQGILLIIVLPILLIYLRYLFTYRRKFSTPFYFNIFIAASILSSILLASNPEEAPDLFSVNGDLRDLMFKGTILFTFFLSFRHKWIPYLTKRQKYIFSFMSLFIIPLLIILFDRLRIPVTDFSLSLLYFFNHIWYFVIFYGFNIMISLWLQLPTASEFEQKLKALSSLHSASREISFYDSTRVLFQKITRTAEALGQAEDIWLQLFRPIGVSPSELIISKMDHQILKDFLQYSFHPKIHEYVRKEKKSILVEDVKTHPQYYPYYFWRNHIRSLIACPLFNRNHNLLGIIYFIHSEPYHFDYSDLELYESFSAQVSLSLENSMLLRELVEKERYQQEMKIAREVQLSLLPSDIPSFAPFSLSFQILTASEVGGDFYDIVTYRDGSRGIVLGDVSGKGTEAAFYMAEFKGIVQAISQLCRSPRELAVLTNRILYKNVERKVFITAIFLQLMPGQRQIRMVRAGHSLPIKIRFRHHSWTEISSRGIGLGLNAGPLFDQHLEEVEFWLGEDEMLFLYTDGLSELKKSNGELFAFNDMIQNLSNEQHINRSADQFNEMVLDSVHAFLGDESVNDDISYIIIR